jgi:hypothetical protein
MEGGELVFAWRNRWRVAGGTLSDPLETPLAGIVREVRPGTSITVRAAGRGLRGIVALGGPTRGRLQGSPDSELRAGGLDVNSAGAILVVGSRVDAEALTRARAMGVRGVVVTGLSSKERRDYLASEAASAGAAPPAAIRRAGPRRCVRAGGGAVLALLGALAGHGRDRHGHADARLRPPLQVVPPPVDLVRIRGGARRPRGRFVEAIGRAASRAGSISGAWCASPMDHSGGPDRRPGALRQRRFRAAVDP